MNEEIVINSELKNLINKNKLQNEIDHHTKNLFKVDNERTDFRKTNDLEFQIQNINLEIKINFQNISKRRIPTILQSIRFKSYLRKMRH